MGRRVQAFVLVVTLLLAGNSAQAADDFHVDLVNCTVQGHDLETVLRWTADTIDFSSQRYHLYEQLSLSGPQSGVYFGACTIGPRHGQAMVIDFVADTAGRGGLVIKPPISHQATPAMTQQLFGAHTQAQPLLRSGGVLGMRYEWHDLCPGFVFRLHFDENDHLTSLMVYPH